MMTSVLTLIAAECLDDSMLRRVREALADAGAQLDLPVWLSAGRAADLAFTGLTDASARALAGQVLAGQPVDLVAQPTLHRRKGLLLADMDSTIVQSETLDELAAFAGLKQEIAAVTARSMRGEIDFKQALRHRVDLLAGLPQSALAATLAETQLMPGALTLVATMRRHGAYAVLVSGGFDYFTAAIRARCGFDLDCANRLELIDGALTGRVHEPILDQDAKLAHLRRFTALRGLTAAETMAVGDGANDLAMVSAAGLGVAYHAKPVLAAAAAFRVDYNDLTALLFAQGYRQDEFVG